MNYWNNKHQDAILLYYYCQSATTSATTRHYLYNNVLITPLTYMVKSAINSTNSKYNNEDIIQECLIHLYVKLLPELKRDKLQGAFYFLFKSLRWFIITQIVREENKNKQLPIDHNYDNYTFKSSDGRNENEDSIEHNQYMVNSDEADADINADETRQAILTALDHKINCERVINKANTVYLILLKQYLIDNNYDERGFGDYIQKKMNITLSTYRAISSRLKISTKILNVNLT
jgi:hypothetical protein